MNSIRADRTALKRVAGIFPSNVDKHSVDGEPEVRLCNYVDVYKNERITADMEFMEATASESQIGRFTLRANDVLITKDSEEPTDIGIPAHVPADLPGVVCGYHLAILRSHSDRLSGRFLHWALQSAEVQAYYSTAATGISRYALSVNDIGMTPLRIPSLAEQERIANFLDEKTARIDALIAAKQQLVLQLDEYFDSRLTDAVRRGNHEDDDLVDSKTQWLGAVPRHWKLTRFSDIARVVRGASPRPAGDPRYFNGDFVPWLTVGEITKDESRYLTSTETCLTREGADHSRKLKAGTLVFSNSGATLGVPKILSIDVCANDGVVAFEALCQNVDIRFAYYYLLSLTKTLRDWIRQGAGQPNLNTSIVRALPIPVPPLPEQQDIVGEIERADEHRASLKKHVREHVERLQEYRDSFITGAVAGKIPAVVKKDAA